MTTHKSTTENFDFELRSVTSMAWVNTVLGDFDTFLLDHLSCERKASAVGMSFILRYPDRPLIIDALIHFSREELEHFHQVYRLVSSRGLTLLPDAEDVYVNKLMKAVRTGRDERFIDRMVVSSIIEARGAERLALLSEHLTDPKLHHFYKRLAAAEIQHRGLFIKLLGHYFSKETIDHRVQHFLDFESNCIQNIPLRPLVH